MTEPIQITFYHRNLNPDFSVRRLFNDVRRALPEGFISRVAISRYPSQGFWKRVYNIIEAAFRQGEVNHITGDVHFLAYLLHKQRTLLTILDLVTVHRLSGIHKAIFLFFWYWLPIKRSAIVTVISESTRQDLLRHVSVEPVKIRVVHCPISDAFRPVPKPFPEDRPKILIIGTRPNKNVNRVVQALKGIPCQLRIIGELNDEQENCLRQCGLDYSAVSSISDEQVVEEFSECDMLVFASTYEGFGLPIVEAQATGRPVVTSKILSMSEVGGDAACLVDPYDVDSIRRGIQKVIEDPDYRNQLVTNGFENVERFRAVKIAAQYADIYLELASHSIKEK